MKWWNVTQVLRTPVGKHRAIPLGDVYAPHQPAALALAWERWPDKLDDTQTQRGLSVRLCDCEDCRDRIA
jgi:hypothetical protein